MGRGQEARKNLRVEGQGSAHSQGRPARPTETTTVADAAAYAGACGVCDVRCEVVL